MRHGIVASLFCIGLVSSSLAAQSHSQLLAEWATLRAGATAPDRLTKLRDLASRFMVAGLERESVDIWREAQSIARQGSGADSSAVATITSNLGAALVADGKPAEALVELTSAMRSLESTADEVALARMRFQAGRARLESADAAAALRDFEAAKAVFDKHSECSEDGSRAQLYGARSLALLDRAKETIASLRQLQKSWVPSLAADDPQREMVASHLGWALLCAGQTDQAIKVFAELLPDAGARARRPVDAANQAGALSRAGHYGEANAIFEQVLPVLERDHGRVWLAAACAHTNCLLMQGRVREAAEAFARIEVEVERSPITEDLARVNVASLKSRLLAWKGESKRARDVVREALEVVERSHPRGDRVWCAAAWEAAECSSRIGDYVAAEGLYRAVYDVVSKDETADRRELAQAQCNLGMALLQLKRLDEAEPLVTTALRSMRKIYPAGDPNTQVALRTMIAIANERGDRRRSLELLRDMLLGAAMRPDGFDAQVTMPLLAAAVEERLSGQSGAAVQLATLVCSTAEANLPADHAIVPFLRIAKDWLGSNASTEDAVAIRNRAEGFYAAIRSSNAADPELRQLAGSLMVLLRWGAGAFEPALALQEELHEMPVLVQSREESAFLIATLRRELGEVARAGREFERLSREVPPSDGYLRALVDASFAYTTLSGGDAVGAHEVMRTAVLRSLRYSCAELGTSYRARAQSNQRLGMMLSGLLSTSVDHPEFASGDLAILLGMRGLAGEQARQQTLWKSRLDANPALRAKHEAMAAAQENVRRLTASQSTRELAVALTDLKEAERDWGEAIGREFSAEDRQVEELANSMPEHAAAIVTCTYTRYVPQQEGSPMPVPVPSVAAYVVRPHTSPMRVDLGPADAIEAAARAWRDRLAGSGVASRGTMPGRDAETTAEGSDLGKLMAPLWSKMPADVTALLVCPDGALASVPWESLPSGDGLLFEKCRIVYGDSLSSLRPRPARDNPPSVLVLGGVDYDADPGAAPTDATLRPARTTGNWASLPGSDREAKLVAARFAKAPDVKVTTLCGAGATREALLDGMRTARWLHLATHAFAAPAPPVANASREQAIGLLVANREEDQARNCGIVLAGANARRNDGAFLTAAEISLQDLHGCELVVLSACDTNVGARSFGDALAGMNRALHVAGAANTITSLWRVSDEGSAAFFAAFYEVLLGDGAEPAKSIAEALATTRKRLRAAGHGPGVWAAYVYYGTGAVL